ncbi:exonuclease domain-containing protein [Pacificoceanicola onchidii]|uniref:exonuclease domain-containing protein n=1 Tax=Pacificoceanicola onchidii TaxID=2562685 RepID=UPI0010A58556|nr:exonuclease domain-containing protein [Pacificoceanicola onchidii]
MNFFALDYETANADQSSICQIGMTEVRDSAILGTKTWLVNPEVEFDPINSSIHGISASTVSGSEKLSNRLPTLIASLEGSTVVSHTAFDRVATFRACKKLGIAPPQSTWMDSARIARRAWPDDFGSSGYGLKNVAKVLGISFEHHDAGEDSRACAQVVLLASEHTGFTLADWQSRIKKPIMSMPEQTGTPSPDGPFFGATLVFTGSLDLPRREAAMLAAAVGFSVGKSVTQKTDFLVVGDQDVSRLAGKEKSSKHIKAEQLASGGHPIRILSESDFRSLIPVTP